ncbi:MULTISPECIES: DUF5343 domain-containing protein [unclassified Phyllobacterium]|uniref:DUF5343 domain-containing protein n=1 Tax=unclassified Phyllobacterium TaxID=2638441 RepID=UPI003012BF67
MPTYPYVASPGPMAKTVEHLRNRFPKELTSDTLKKLGVAPKNESYVINIIRFLGLIDENGKQIDEKSKAFHQSDDEAFAKEFQVLVRDAYAPLFDLQGEKAWTLSKAQLIQFFRSTDRSTQVVGTRQAGTFQLLAALSGFADMPTTRDTTSKKVAAHKTKTSSEASPTRTARPENVSSAASVPVAVSSTESRVGLTVRIEVNLPADGDQETYDAIFKSIRKNLIDGE